MKQVIYSEVTPNEMANFEAWSGAEDTLEIVKQAEKIEELADLINELLGENIEETKINDFLWFDADYIFEHLGIESEE